MVGYVPKGARRSVATAAGLCLFVLSAPAVCDDGMRCGGNLVTLGDTETQVRDKCGEPTDRLRKTFKLRRGVGRVTWDQWLYDAGPTAFVRILTFDVATDRLIHVETGDYGH